MKAINGRGKQSQNALQRQRNGLLAKVHIAVKDLGVPDGDYRAILTREFGARSAKALSVLELQYLVDYFKSKGFKVQGSEFRVEEKRENQLERLRERAVEIAGAIEDGERRLRGLCKKLCGVDRVEWCRDVARLKRLLAALEKIRKG